MQTKKNQDLTPPRSLCALNRSVCLLLSLLLLLLLVSLWVMLLIIPGSQILLNEVLDRTRKAIFVNLL
jgi:hypothetical protein